MVEMEIFDSFSALADALQKDSTMLFLEDESHYLRQLMRFPIEELSIYPYLLFDALDRIDASHTRSFYEMAPSYEKLYSDYVELLGERYPNVMLGGRLGAYKYWDMDKAIRNALDFAETLEI